VPTARVAKVDGQPLTLTYKDDQGVTRPYTPDALVTYRPDPDTGHIPKPRLYEIKPREKIRAEWPAIKRKYKLARRFDAPLPGAGAARIERGRARERRGRRS